MSRGRRFAALTLAIASVGLVALPAAGCGDDDDAEVTLPTISVEDATTEAAPPTTPEPAPNDTGGVAPVDPNEPDSAANDKVPEPGSPEEAFENACKQNPSACG